MTLSSQQAAASLDDIARTEKRSRELSCYQQGAPYLLLWGLIWIVGYLASALLPRHAAFAWLLLNVAGLIGTALLRWRSGRAWSWRFPILVIVVFSFIAGTYLILPPAHPVQYGAFPPLVVALGYALIGIWGLPRFLWLSAAIFALTLGGYLWLQPWFAFWMAGVGGTSLLIGSVWLRRA